MKKAVIIGPAYPLRGGLATFNQRFAEELKAFHIEPIIYSFKLQYPALLFPGKSQEDTSQSKNGLDIRPRIHSLNPFNWIKVAREIVEIQPDFIICRYWIPFFAPSLGSILRLIKKKSQARIVALVDNLIPHEHRPGDRALTRYFITATDCALVMSDKVRKDVLSLGLHRPIIKLKHPVYDHYGPGISKEKALEHLGLRPGVTYLLFFGFVRKYKGLDLLIRAMAEPGLTSENIQLIVAGDFYEKVEKYRRLIEKLDLTEKVLVYPHYIPNQEVKYYFSACDLVVLPYRAASQSGISQIALNFSKPVLITDVGGLAEIVEEGVNGFIVKPQPAQIAGGILRYLQEKDKALLTKNIGLRNREFSWSNFTGDFLRQLENTLIDRRKQIGQGHLTRKVPAE